MEKEKAEQNERLLRVFRSFDTNNDGLIDEEEFGQMLESLGWDSPLETRSLEFAAIDRDSDGLVKVQEFADWWLDRD